MRRRMFLGGVVALAAAVMFSCSEDEIGGPSSHYPRGFPLTPLFQIDVGGTTCEKGHFWNEDAAVNADAEGLGVVPNLEQCGDLNFNGYTARFDTLS